MAENVPAGGNNLATPSRRPAAAAPLLSRIPLPSLTGNNKRGANPLENRPDESPAKHTRHSAEEGHNQQNDRNHNNHADHGQASKTPQRRSLVPSDRRVSLLATPPGRRLTKTTTMAGKKEKRDLSECRIVVAVRKRPARPDETDAVAVGADGETLRVAYSRPKLDGIGRQLHTHRFAFDRVYDEQRSTREIYLDLVRPLVSLVASAAGGRATVFAYGQTGSGKTHTMFAQPEGVVNLACLDLLQAWERLPPDTHLAVSFYELYQGHLVDLLAERRRLQACEGRDGTISLLGLTERRVERQFEKRAETITASPSLSASQMSPSQSPWAQLQGWLQQGLAQRVTGQTGANAASSRSHAILQLSILRDSHCLSRLSFIDLAGSERGADRQTVGNTPSAVGNQTRLEGSEINKSLLALKECIRALDREASHLPFRASKLTMLLRDSLMGEHVRTAMLATISPSTATVEHTLNTLRYADRLREVGLAAGSGQRGEYVTVEDADCRRQTMDPETARKLDRVERVEAVGREDRRTTLGRDDRQALGSLDRQTLGSLDRQALGSLDRQAFGSLDRQAFGSLDAQAGLGRGDCQAIRREDCRQAIVSVDRQLDSTRRNATATWQVSSVGEANPRLEAIQKSLSAIWKLAVGCGDEDVVTLIGDELNTLHQAFSRLG